jgi:hypothetical protein
MDKYGIDNVRGGSFVSVKLDKSTIDVLKQMTNGTNNKCFVCEKGGHFAKDCVFKLNKNKTVVSNVNKNDYIEKAKYNICINGPKCIGCRGSDRCQSNRVEMLYTNNNKIIYDKNNEIYEECIGKYNCNYHNTGKYLKFNNTTQPACEKNIYFAQDYQANDFWETDDDEYDYEDVEEEDKNNYSCFRCGREGHYATSCYALKHIKGYYLK